METENHHREDALARTLGGLRAAGKVGRGPLALHPLIESVGGDGGVELDLLGDALAAGTLKVEETSMSGSVPELLVSNTGEKPVLILEGDELIGLKQNRTVNSSVLIRNSEDVVLPVSCVERGRWSRSSRLSRSTASSHLSLRRLKSRSVHASLRGRRGHMSDQREVWNEVSRMFRYHEHASETDSLHDARLLLTPKLSDFDSISDELPAATRGVVVSIGGSPVALELLPDARTFSRVSERLVHGYAMDALEHSPNADGETDGEIGNREVRDILQKLARIPAEIHAPVGSGRDIRFEDGDVSGYALLDGERTLHAAAFFGG